MSTSPYHLNKKHVRRHFERAATSYAEHARLQQIVATHLLERFDYIRITPERILDLGCGSGQISLPLQARYPQALLCALDIAFPMVKATWQNATKSARNSISMLCADAEALPITGASVDLVVSNLMLQWCNDPGLVFAEVKRVLRPGGLFVFTTFGPDTLQELRSCWNCIDEGSHVNAFYDMHDIGDMLLHQGFTDPVLDADRFVMSYSELRDLLLELKGIGATNVTAGRARGLTGKNKFTKLTELYETLRSDGVLPATYEVIHGQAWVASTSISVEFGI